MSLLGSGFGVFRTYFIAKDTPEETISLLRDSYMAGADFLFANVMDMLNEHERSAQPVMDELNAWREEMIAKQQQGK